MVRTAGLSGGYELIKYCVCVCACVFERVRRAVYCMSACQLPGVLSSLYITFTE